MKKIIAAVISLMFLICALSGCAERASTSEPVQTEQPESPQAEMTQETAPELTQVPVQTEAPKQDGEPEGDPAAAEEPDAGASGEYVPDYSFYSEGLTEEGFFEGVAAAEIVELPEYKGVSVPANVTAVDPAELEDFLRYEVLAPYAETVQVTDRAVENYDTVNIDYTGYMDDVAFDGGSTQGMGTDVTIGVTSYIDDFLEQLIGHRPGDDFDIFVTFPDPYPNNPDLAGREARFHITINYIAESSEVELTDEIAAEYGFESGEALAARAEEMLLEDARTAFLSSVLDQAVCPDIPESVTTYFENYLIGYYSITYNMDFSDSREEILADSADLIRSLAVSNLAAQAICEKEGLRAGEADLEAIGILPYLDVYGTPFAMQTALVSRVVPDFIIENGVPAT